MCENKVSEAASTHSETAESVLGENKFSEFACSHAKTVKNKCKKREKDLLLASSHADTIIKEVQGEKNGTKSAIREND